MHDQIRIAPDGRGEMGVILQGQPEMAKILRRVIGLRHAAQGRDVQQFVEFRPLRLGQQPVQMRGLQHLPLGKGKARRLRHFAQRLQLFGAGLFMHAEQQRPLQPDQFFCGGDIGEDHAFLDQPVRIEPFAEGDRQHLARVAQDDLAFRQIQIQRLADGPPAFQHLITGIDRRDHLGHQRCQLRFHRTVDGGLHLAIMQRGARPHQTAGKAVPDLVALRIDLHPHRHAGAIDILMQRAQIPRKRVGQHRHNPVGEIGGIAALARFTVQC